MKTQEKNKKTASWATVGQSGAKQLLDSFLHSSKAVLPHAFLFFGPGGVGKFKLAKEFASKIASSSNHQLEQYVFDFADNNGLEELRELIRMSSLTAAGGSKKIFLLKNFHLAPASSLNALLKTLEEPAQSSMFVLISDSNSALPTIMSRVIAVRCFPVEAAPVAGLPEPLLSTVTGFPETAARLIEQPELAETLNNLLTGLSQKRAHGLALADLTSFADLDKEPLRLLLALRANQLKQQLLTSSDPIPVMRALRAVQTAHDELARNFNTKLVLQEMLTHS